VDEVAVVLATLEPPPDKLGVTHWSSRLLAGHLGGISNVWVARIWRKWALAPWRRETFKFCTDPELEAKVRDVVGLYLAPPEKAVVLSIDELGRAEAHHCSEEQRVSSTRPPSEVDRRRGAVGQVLFRRSLPERGVRVSSHPALQ
jgi:hypothetical protein